MESNPGATAATLDGLLLGGWENACRQCSSPSMPNASSLCIAQGRQTVLLAGQLGHFW
jgi:hypothetical protein